MPLPGTEAMKRKMDLIRWTLTTMMIWPSSLRMKSKRRILSSSPCTTEGNQPRQLTKRSLNLH